MRRIYLVCTVLVLGLWLSGTAANAQNQIRNWEFDEPFVTGGGGDVNTNWWLWESANFTGLSVVHGAALSGEMIMPTDRRSPNTPPIGWGFTPSVETYALRHLA